MCTPKSEIVGVVDYKTIDASKFHKMVDAILNEAAGSGLSGLGVDSAVSRTRNLMASVFGFDLSMNSTKPVYNASMFTVMDIDGDCDPPELALRDMVVGLPIIVDLTPSEVQAIQSADIGKGGVIAATLMSIPNEQELTTCWRLRSPLEAILRGWSSFALSFQVSPAYFARTYRWPAAPFAQC